MGGKEVRPVVGVDDVQSQAVHHDDDDMVGRPYHVDDGGGARRAGDVPRAADGRESVGEVDDVQPVGRRAYKLAGIERRQQPLYITHVWTHTPLSNILYPQFLRRELRREW